jgi:hypothetical protein
MAEYQFNAYYGGEISFQGGETFDAVYVATDGTVDTEDIDVEATTWRSEDEAGVKYNIIRYFTFFDTSSIDDGETITEAYLVLRSTAWNEDDFDIQVLSGQPTYPSYPLAEGDYDYTHYTDCLISSSVTIIPATEEESEKYDIIFKIDTDVINKTGTTKLCLRSKFDFHYQAP